MAYCSPLHRQNINGGAFHHWSGWPFVPIWRRFAAAPSGSILFASPLRVPFIGLPLLLYCLTQAAALRPLLRGRRLAFNPPSFTIPVSRMPRIIGAVLFYIIIAAPFLIELAAICSTVPSRAARCASRFNSHHFSFPASRRFNILPLRTFLGSNTNAPSDAYTDAAFAVVDAFLADVADNCLCACRQMPGASPTYRPSVSISPTRHCFSPARVRLNPALL